VALSLQETKNILKNNIYRYRARQKGIPGIIICTLPKSATVYIRAKLSQGLKLPNYGISLGPFLDQLIIPEIVDKIALGGAVGGSHFSANKIG